MSRVAQIYEKLWYEAEKQFQLGQFKIDPLLNAPHDARRGVTLLARLSPDVSERISRFLSHTKTIEPQQYYYPPSDFHLTFLSIITCYDGFRLDHIQPADYISLISDCLASVKPIRIQFKGITASPSCIMIQGFPVDDQLHQLRNALRNKFRQSSLQHSIDSRYPIQTAHSTVIRFQNTIQQASKLIEHLEAYREHDFGQLTIDTLEFVLNDWYQKQEHTQVIHQFNMG